ncbi:dihydrofolate reductase-like domain-containing protein [Pseudoneurospora amorphoporcata]|uniref:2,5-diamino-6-ribosylamino-4(3H)-pyrimidinone 5'-phosphate reductase n=1 Tax=Pseudoneurospora amorphoporcata TaxID=241081 RepID=A0AAN6P2Y4_9PEZI|nr:dihydrofolate reductase-like domain-containing protein [Pseudoneurospora amorphoporcata]
MAFTVQPAEPQGTPPTDGLLHFPASSALKLEPHLPPVASTDTTTRPDKPFVTLTFATSLDSSLSLAPGVRTTLSGPQSKAMTHYLRSRHAAILVGVGTAVADDPGLNCKIISPFVPEGVREQHPHQPRPIILDPSARWEVNAESKVIQLARLGQGLGPLVFVAKEVRSVPDERRAVVEGVGGKFVRVKSVEGEEFTWTDVLWTIKEEGLDSVMIEGGGSVINSLLSLEQGGEQELVDSVIVTIAPTWLGAGGVLVCPPRAVGKDGQPVPPVRLRDVSWHPLGEDVVLCGKILR